MGIFLALLMIMLLAPCAVARPHYYKAASAPSGNDSAIMWNNRGVDLYSAGRLEAAIGAYDRAIKINPRYTDAYSNRGVAYDAMNQPERAVQDYSHAIQLNPSLTTSYVNRGLAYTDLAKFKDAVSDWNIVLRRSPRNADAYYRRGFCYQSMGSLDKALADYEKATKLNPRLAKAVKNRDLMRKALAIKPAASESSFTPLPMEKQPQPVIEQMDQSSKMARRVEKPLPEQTIVVPPSTVQTEQPKIAAAVPLRPVAIGPAAFCVSVLHHVVGNLCSSVHQYDAAASSFTGALNINPGDQFAYYRRGNSYLHAGKKSLALADYQSALSINPHFRQAEQKRAKLTQETGGQ